MFKQYRKKSFWVISCIMAVFGTTFVAGLYYWRQWLMSHWPAGQGQVFLIENVPLLTSFLSETGFYQWVLPGIFIAFILAGVIIWIGLSVFVANIFQQEQEQEPVRQPQSGGSQKKDFIDRKLEQDRKRRLFLHALSVLQREGRLLDFFDEDLSVYEDSQIGAAVRSIQEDCKKAVKKYIDPKPVVSGEEGDVITIEEGFDIDAINLVGSVSGHPPFQGIIKHPGWKAEKKEVPKLSDTQEPSIMAPAEIEIQ